MSATKSVPIFPSLLNEAETAEYLKVAEQGWELSVPHDLAKFTRFLSGVTVSRGNVDAM